ncbi:hypothetical protein QFZ55_006234 [Streptomyces luteogriseus]|nr:hypothetical protein [Streptomyces luteogriseus]
MGCLHQFTPAVERLRIAAFHSGQEALHRVAWMGQATVLAQAVGLGATWNTDLVRGGEAASTEIRAMRARDDRVGLNLRSPKTRSVDLFVGDGPVLVVLTLLPGTAEPHGFAD